MTRFDDHIYKPRSKAVGLSLICDLGARRIGRERRAL